MNLCIGPISHISFLSHLTHSSNGRLRAHTFINTGGAECIRARGRRGCVRCRGEGCTRCGDRCATRAVRGGRDRAATVRLSTSLPVCLPLCMSVSVCLCVCLCVCRLPAVCLPLCLPASVSICQSLFICRVSLSMSLCISVQERTYNK